MQNNVSITIERSNRRTVALHIQPDATVLVKAPNHMPQRQIDSFIEEHNEWIVKRLAVVEERLKHRRNEDEYFFLGKTLKLTPGNYKEIAVKEDKLLFPVALMFRKEKELTAWYRKQAKNIISEQVKSYALQMKAEYKEITFSDTKSQWGRCTHDNRLQFSWRLVMAPMLVINYVIIHELSHTFEKNHTQMFWMKVRNFNPSYRQQIKWLKEHGASLHF